MYRKFLSICRLPEQRDGGKRSWGGSEEAEGYESYKQYFVMMSRTHRYFNNIVLERQTEWLTDGQTVRENVWRERDGKSNAFREGERQWRGVQWDLETIRIYILIIFVLDISRRFSALSVLNQYFLKKWALTMKLKIEISARLKIIAASITTNSSDNETKGAKMSENTIRAYSRWLTLWQIWWGEWGYI